MPLPGGDADKVGNRYEGKWIVNSFLDVLEERFSSIQIEPPGLDDSGFEFFVEAQHQHWHQVKRQTSKGKWTLSQLAGVLGNFWNKLRDPNCYCHFVSTYSAHELNELASRSRDATTTTFDGFERLFLNTENWRNEFDTVKRYFGTSDDNAAFEALKRIYVRTMDETSLETIVSSRLASLVMCDEPDTVRDILTQFALENIHRTLTALDIWHHLESRGYHRRNWNSDPKILVKLQVQNDNYKRPIVRDAILDEAIPRQATQQILDALLNLETKKTIFITGAAGGGKSGVALQLANTLEQRAIPYLALRVDRLSTVNRAAAIGGQLGLPESPANVLAGYAKGRLSVLIIDQLDAVSLASGRNSEFYDCIAELIEQGRLVHKDLRLVLVSRAYDVKNDHRFRKLLEHEDVLEVPVNPLTPEQIQGVLVKLNKDVNVLKEQQLKLLSLPLNLKLLSEIKTTDVFKRFAFTTTKDLYDAFWNYKQDVLRVRLGRKPAWIEVLDALVSYMSEHETLSAPENRVDTNRSDAETMVSEHVLTKDGSRYAFFHEGFFDYVFARRFITQHDLIPFLERDEQHLFRRAQVRQILLHERDSDFQKYLDDVSVLMQHPELRYHLKQVVFSLLASLVDPRLEEWKLLQPHLENAQSPIFTEVFRVFNTSPYWFDFLFQQGILQAWLCGETHKQLGISLMLSVARSRQDLIAELVEPYFTQPGQWRDYLISIMEFANVTGSGKLSDSFLKMIDLGVFDDRTFWNQIWHLTKEGAGYGAVVVGRYLTHSLRRALALGETNPLSDTARVIDTDSSSESVIIEMAQSAPEAFIEHVFPVILTLLKTNHQVGCDGITRCTIWSEYLRWGRTHDIAGALLAALIHSLKSVAQRHPETLVTVVDGLEVVDVDVAQELIAVIFCQAPSFFAQRALNYFSGASSRLEIPQYGDYAWGARAVIEAIHPYLTDEQITALETTVLDCWPIYYQKYHHAKRSSFTYPITHIGKNQLILLDGFPVERLSDRGRRRLFEWRRKFAHEKKPLRKPRFQGGMAEVVGAPRPGKAATKMTDEQWVKAMQKYDKDDIDWSGDHPTGGVHQLASVFQEQVKLQPERFIKLIETRSAEIPQYYVASLLWGLLDNTAITTEAITPVLDLCHQWTDRPFGMVLCRFVQNRAEENISEQVLELVSWYALNDPDPKEDELDDKQADGGLTSRGINSVRGQVAESIAHLIWNHPARLEYFRPTLQKMLLDPSLAVRVWVVEVLVGTLKHERDTAVTWFLQLAQVEDDRFFCTRSVDEFLHYAIHTHWPLLEPVVLRMVVSSNEEVSRLGATRLCFAALVNGVEPELITNFADATEAHRIGLAQVYAANVDIAKHRDRCEKALTTLFYDSSPKVREAAADCFRHIDANELQNYRSLIEAYISSPSFKKGHDHLLYALQRSTSNMPDIYRTACQAWVDKMPDMDYQESYSPHVDDLAIRAYNQSLHTRNRDLQLLCLNLIDLVTASGRFDLRETFELFERG